MFVDTISLDTLCSDAGEASFTGATYACTGTADMLVVDCGLDLDELLVETLVVTVSSDTEPGGESVLLTETSAGSARFAGSVALDTVDAPGVLAVTAGDTITVSYLDADDGMGGLGVLVTGTAQIDCTAPNVTTVNVTGLSSFGATITYTTDEAATATVDFGSACGNLTDSESSTSFTTSGAVALTGLQDDTTYFLTLTATDAAGNTGEGSNVVLLPEPATGAGLLLGVGCVFGLGRRRVGSALRGGSAARRPAREGRGTLARGRRV